MLDIKEFMASLADSEATLKAVSEREARDGYNFEDTADRKYEEGFIDGMRHAYILLTGDNPPCDHDNYSESVFTCSQHGDDAPCHERHCDNCDEITLHEREDGADDEEDN